jgi:SulP family sulfate permease
MAAGFLRLGTYVKFVPYPVTVGFTAGIAIIIFASQVKDLLGMTLTGHEPGDLIPKIKALSAAWQSINPSAVLVAALTIVVIAVLRRFRPSWPGLLIAVGLAAFAAWLFSLPVETIGTRFGGIPRTLPLPALPDLSLTNITTVLPDAAAFAVLGAIESLLSAVVADGMTGRRHRSNCELVAQGAANIGSALFGGICVTGTIARTATNVRAGARGPISGMLHSAFLLLFMLVAAPLASFIPLPALAGVLATVAWTMVEKHAFASLIRSSWSDAAVLLATFLLTMFVGLMEGILVGFAIGALVFIDRMAQATGVEAVVAPRDAADDDEPARGPYDAGLATDPAVTVYRVTGVFFFGAASAVGAVLDEAATRNKALVIDISAVPLLDSTAANTLEGVARKAARAEVPMFITGASAATQRTLLAHGVTGAIYLPTIEAAVAQAHQRTRA